LEDDLKDKDQKLADLADKNQQLKDEQAAMMSALPSMPAKNQPRIVKASASDPPFCLRCEIANKLANRFKSMGLDVVTDKDTGSITLFLDEAFLFLNNSYYLRKVVKNKLDALIPVYAEELFEDPEIRDNITTVNIVGHASPRYMGRAVVPRTASYKSYEYNLTLSANRALQITRYVVSDKIGNYRYKAILRQKAKSSGKSFMHPLPLRRGEKRIRDCGVFSCKRSRRVEISFSLDNEDAGATEMMREEMAAIKRAEKLKNALKVLESGKVKARERQEEPKSMLGKIFDLFSFAY
jgi:outer membrane protein OmpA-like peptidoglycan-associated protein